MFTKSFIYCVLACLFIVFDFIRQLIPGGYVIYEYTAIVIALISLISITVSFKRILEMEHKYFYLSATLFCLLIVAIEIYHSGFNNIVVLAEHVCWIILPLLFVISKPKEKELYIISGVFIVLNLFIAIPSILNHFIDLPGSTKPGVLFVNDGGYYGNRNVNSMINAISAIVCIRMFFVTENRYVKISSICAMLINAVCVMFSGSRTSMIGIVLVVFVYLLYFVKNKIARVFICLSTFSATVFVALYRFKDIIFSSSISPEFLDKISSGRYFIWEEMLRMMKFSLFTGFGVGTVKGNAMKLLGKNAELADPKSTINNAHNLFINILYNSGLIAMLYFIGMCIYYLAIILKKPMTLKRISTLMIVLCGFLISMLDIPLLYTTSVINIIWWLFVFYSVSEA